MDFLMFFSGLLATLPSNTNNNGDGNEAASGLGPFSGVNSQESTLITGAHLTTFSANFLCMYKMTLIMFTFIFTYLSEPFISKLSRTVPIMCCVI